MFWHGPCKEEGPSAATAAGERTSSPNAEFSADKRVSSEGSLRGETQLDQIVQESTKGARSEKTAAPGIMTNPEVQSRLRRPHAETLRLSWSEKKGREWRLGD